MNECSSSARMGGGAVPELVAQAHRSVCTAVAARLLARLGALLIHATPAIVVDNASKRLFHALADDFGRPCEGL